MSDLISRAAEYARAAHGSIEQRRKYSKEPYIVHPEAVARSVADVTDDEATIAAAWLHDVVEDTPVTIDQIEEQFGADIGQLVAALTNTATKQDGNRQRRNEIENRRLAQADARAQTVKLADLIDNLGDIATVDPGFARRYVVEKERQLKVLAEGHPQLYRRAEDTIREAQRIVASLDS